MASANYTTWYLVSMNGAMAGGSHFKICKTEKERDEYVAQLCEKIVNNQVPNCDRPSIVIRVDHHERPCGGLIK